MNETETTTTNFEAWVCIDCYFAHHYGTTHRTHVVDGVTVSDEWFAGESDTPCDCEPLNLLDGCDLSDNTDSETGEGMDTFSSSYCQGCGSSLGGERYRLAAR